MTKHEQTEPLDVQGMDPEPATPIEDFTTFPDKHDGSPKIENPGHGHARASADEPLHPFCQLEGESSQERADRIRKAHTQTK